MRLPPRHNQGGMALIAAIFLIVVLAALGLAVLRLNVSQQHSDNLSLQRMRAEWATRAGLEYGAQRALVGGTCSPTTPLSLNGFTMQVRCNPVAGGFKLDVFAVSGSYGMPDYVSYSATRTVGP